ncbi:MAG TPA: beta-glucanase, partial [Bacteroidaceae bacterium]|nr:beta-glucanase [Bacteroidaceae bacterium]
MIEILRKFFQGLKISGLCILISGPGLSSQEPQESKIWHDRFTPGTIWFDTDSIHINAHGGGIVLYEGIYYWFGEHKTAGRGGNTALIGIRCYSSEDLYNWKNEGVALASVNDPDSEIVRGCVMERPKVIFNEKTGKFVMWFHLELRGQGYRAARTALAVSDHVIGPYTYVRSFRVNPGIWPVDFTDEMKTRIDASDLKSWTPEWIEAVADGYFVRRDLDAGQMSRDMTLFVDDDGTAYHIHSSEENLTLHIAELTPDYMDFTGKWTRVFPGGHNEAPAIFKHRDTYYMITSGCTGWEPNEARSAVSASIWGPWEPLGNPCRGEHAEMTFYSQSTFVLPVAGAEDAFIFMADRWRPRNPIDGRYVWLPIHFENELPVIKWFDEWD